MQLRRSTGGSPFDETSEVAPLPRPTLLLRLQALLLFRRSILLHHQSLTRRRPLIGLPFSSHVYRILQSDARARFLHQHSWWTIFSMRTRCR